MNPYISNKVPPELLQWDMKEAEGGGTEPSAKLFT